MSHHDIPEGSGVAAQADSISVSALTHQIYRQIAVELIAATDAIATRMIEQVRVAYTQDADHFDQVTESILNIRREVHQAATRIAEKCAGDREDRIARVRATLGMTLNVAAAFLLDLVDEPGRPHSGRGAPSDLDRRRLAVYAAHIRRALAPYDLDSALITVRSRGYMLSPPDADLIRMLWEEVS